ncbi:MAG: ArnT family glycosyltransferase [Burkholderiales bacterium]
MNAAVTVSERSLRVLLALAAASFIPALFYYAVGEEAVTTISALEMAQNGQWFDRRLYGLPLQHETFSNWLVAAVASVIGWPQVLIAARAVTIAATLGSAALAGWLAGALTRDRATALFVALTYLTLADVLFYRGWLAYVDPVFAFFIFAGIACLWVACERQRAGWLALAVLAMTAAYLTKAITAYVFYGVAFIALAVDARRRRFLLSAPSLVLHLAMAAAPVLWLLAVRGDLSRLTGMLNYTASRFDAGASDVSWTNYAIFPLKLAGRLLPATALAAWCLWRYRGTLGVRRATVVLALAIALINCLPYWASPQSNVRYLLPVFPLFALALGLVVWQAGPRAVKLAVRCMAVMVGLKLLFAVALFPWYQHHYRGKNYADIAAAIQARVGDRTLYTLNDTAAGLSVIGYLDTRRWPAPAIVWAPEGWDNAYAIAEEGDAAQGRVVERFKLGGDEVLLLCRGSACDAR